MDMQCDSSSDVVLIGAGIMSATLGSFLKELQPDWHIQVFERLSDVANESSNAWNNAGTGHSALCELNYTPLQANGQVDISKAIKIMEQFEVSKQFWASLVNGQKLGDPRAFIRSVPHISVVKGDVNVRFLRQRYQTLRQYRLFENMVYTEDKAQMAQWVPLMMSGRDQGDVLAATYCDLGTDVNFGELSRAMMRYLVSVGCGVAFEHEITDLKRLPDKRWCVVVKDLQTGQRRKISTRFVFIGAGGGALHLLQKSGIPESRGFGGFPVSGQWLVCDRPQVVQQHHAKVYGKAPLGAPPMSVPHLDKRVIGGKEALLFGPFAGFTTKFLKKGSYSDLFKTIRGSNVRPMLKVGFHNLALERYLVQQVKMSLDDRLTLLRRFYPEARDEDWRLGVAGNRVQVIKKDPLKGGILQFGTQIVKSADGSLSALLGASPGASTSVSIMLELLAQCFPDRVRRQWQDKLYALIPSYGRLLENDPLLVDRVRAWSMDSLSLGGARTQTQLRPRVAG